jgi:hypothetical protein
MAAGLLLAAYGVIVLFSLDQLVLGKFSSGTRDTSSALLIFLIGCASFFGGLWMDNSNAE